MRTINIYITTIIFVLFFTDCFQKKTENKLSDEYWVNAYKTQSRDIFLTEVKTTVDSLLMVSPEETESYIRKISNILYKENNINLAALIAAYPYGIEVSPDEYSEIANRLLTSVRLPGNQAPQIEGVELNNKPSIVLFYESDCPSCKPVINKLIDNYDYLKGKGYDVVSISSDTDKNIFESNAKLFPWQYKLCDYKSFNSPNFIRWGVASTPVLYLIDKNHQVVGQYGSLDDMQILSKH